MTRFEKTVKKGLECCAAGSCVKSKCPYYREMDDLDTEFVCNTELARDALKLIKELKLELLKEREAVKPKEVNLYPTVQYACGFCGHISVGSKDYHARYCPECGRAVKWDE